jgi:hypothetical protein
MMGYRPTAPLDMILVKEVVFFLKKKLLGNLLAIKLHYRPTNGEVIPPGIENATTRNLPGITFMELRQLREINSSFL